MNDFYGRRASEIRSIAEIADPFTKKRLLALAGSYDARIGTPSQATRGQAQQPAVRHMESSHQRNDSRQ